MFNTANFYKHHFAYLNLGVLIFPYRQLTNLEGDWAEFLPQVLC